MKNYFTLLAISILAFLQVTVFCQTWEYLTPIRSYTQIKGCSFLDENRGVAVSYIDDDIFMTIDGGDSWQGLAGPPTVGTAMDIEWVSEDLFIIAASNGDLFRTSNGGVSWQNMNPPATDWLYNVDFINATTGFVTGNNGVLLKTVDAGLTWTLIPTGTTNRIVDIDFSDELNGCAAAWNGTLLRTTDGGDSWNIIPVPTTTSLQSVQFVDANIGFASGGVVLKTTDGGITWNSVYSNSSSFFNVVYVNESGQGYAVGGAGVFIKTSNMGSTWQAQTALGDGDIFCGDHTATGEAYLFGKKNIHKSINSGASWTVIKNEAPGGDVRDIQFTNDNSGWCVSTAIGGNNNGGIAQTTDGGRTWNIRQTATSGGWYAVDFPTAQTGYVLGTSQLAKTTNGGLNWTYTTPFTLSGKCLHFRNAQTGYAGGLGSSSNICKTTNGATSFTCGNNIGAAAIYFINDQKGIAIRNITGGDTYYKTFDGGNTWEYHNGLLGSCIEFFGEQKGWVGSYSGVFRTLDGGDTWEFVYVGSNLFIEVRFFDENTGYCVSDEGLIFRTTNGGASWEYAFPNEEVYVGALCAEITENYCYIGTVWGGVLRTSLQCTGEGPYPCVVSCPSEIELSSTSCGSVNVNLNNNNSSDVVWNFGDGSQDTTSVSATHYYAQNGEYVITAEHSSSDCALNIITDTIVVNCYLNDCPTGILAQNDSCNMFDFSVLTNDTTAVVFWDFGDGDTLTSLAEVEHVYSDNGVYIVTSTYYAASCPIPWTQVYTVQVDCPVVECPTEIVNNESSCGVYDFELLNSSVGMVSWNFGDNSLEVLGASVSHTFLENGVYIITGNFSGENCPLYDFIDTVTVNCLYNNCPSAITAITNSCNEFDFILDVETNADVTWAFGDGNTFSDDINTTHTFLNNGVYIVTAIYNGEACPIPWTQVYTIEVHCPVIECPSEIIVTTDVCGLYNFTIQNPSADIIEWSFGDNTSFFAASATSHAYSANGEFIVSAIITDSLCGTTIILDTLVVDCIAPICNASFEVTTLATPGQLQIINTSLTSDSAEYLFDYSPQGNDLGNGLIQYNNNGDYIICLSLISANCNVVYCDTISITNFQEPCDLNSLTLLTDIHYFETGFDTVEIVISDSDSVWYSNTWSQQVSASDTMEICLPDGCYEIQLNGGSPITAITIQAQILSELPEAISNGIITLEMGDQYASSYFGVSMDCAVSTGEESLESILVFPNPATESVRVLSSYVFDEVNLFSLDGRWIQNSNCDSNSILLDVSSIPSGLYILKLDLPQSTGSKLLLFEVMH